MSAEGEFMQGGARLLNDPAYSAAIGGAFPSGAANVNCPNCGGPVATPMAMASSDFVYAIGQLTPQFPDLGVEKEFAQLGGSAAAGFVETDRLVEALGDPSAAYLARQLCWVFSAGGVEAFTLVARDDAQTQSLVDALPRAEDGDETVQVVIGALGAPLPGSPCTAATLPAVWIDQHLTFARSAFLDALAGADADRGGKESKAVKADDAFRGAAMDMFARLTRRSDNRGMSDEHRAANYLALRYPPLYRLAADAYRDDKALVDVQVRRGPAGSRRLVAVRPVFRGRRSDMVERYQCTVDVTDRFPFLTAPLSPIYD